MEETRLPGEPADSRVIEDIIHWVGIYREMITGVARRRLSDAEAAAMRRRYDFWVMRLGGAAASGRWRAERPEGREASPEEIGDESAGRRRTSGPET